MTAVILPDSKLLSQTSEGFKSLLPYLYNMKEFWSLQSQVKENLIANLPTRDSTKHRGINKEELKRLTLMQLQITSSQSRLQLVMKNATSNFNIDNNIIDPSARENFEKIAQKWPIALQT